MFILVKTNCSYADQTKFIPLFNTLDSEKRSAKNGYNLVLILNTVKILKIGTPETNTVIVLQME